MHVDWALAAGGRLGVGNDPRYNKSRCFEPFPFPSDDTGLTPALTERIRQLAEQLDAHRKARQAAARGVTLTGLYNVLDKLRRGEAAHRQRQGAARAGPGERAAEPARRAGRRGVDGLRLERPGRRAVDATKPRAPRGPRRCWSDWWR
ncbi:MAG: hypothetical protein V9G29_14190 [Burkholderiaceae bacterium]